MFRWKWGRKASATKYYQAAYHRLNLSGQPFCRKRIQATDIVNFKPPASLCCKGCLARDTLKSRKRGQANDPMHTDEVSESV
jgi:hypothetical protein